MENETIILCESCYDAIMPRENCFQIDECNHILCNKCLEGIVVSSSNGLELIKCSVCEKRFNSMTLIRPIDMNQN